MKIGIDTLTIGKKTYKMAAQDIATILSPVTQLLVMTIHHNAYDDGSGTCSLQIATADGEKSIEILNGRDETMVIKIDGHAEESGSIDKVVTGLIESMERCQFYLAGALKDGMVRDMIKTDLIENAGYLRDEMREYRNNL